MNNPSKFRLLVVLLAFALLGSTLSAQMQLEAYLENIGAYKELASASGTLDGGTYVTFGSFPQTLKASNVNITEKSETRAGLTYYRGSDGAWYVKVTANPYLNYSCSDGTKLWKDRVYYFKVEPIKWRVLETSVGQGKERFLVAESILVSNIPFYGSTRNRVVNNNTIYPSNYSYSNIRAWLNGTQNYYCTATGSTPSDYDMDWTGKGFLQIAFTASQQMQINDTMVDNRRESTGDAAKNFSANSDNVCENTIDKIFLLSEKEVTSAGYGFAAYKTAGKGNTRIRMPTDYAKANYCWLYTDEEGYGGWWWLRSPDGNTDARCADRNGQAYNYASVNALTGGVVPALWVTP